MSTTGFQVWNTSSLLPNRCWHDLFNQMLAITETAAHLQLLAAQGRVSRHEADGLRYYLPA